MSSNKHTVAKRIESATLGLFTFALGFIILVPSTHEYGYAHAIEKTEIGVEYTFSSFDSMTSGKIKKTIPVISYSNLVQLEAQRAEDAQIEEQKRIALALKRKELEREKQAIVADRKTSTNDKLPESPLARPIAPSITVQ